MHIEYLLPTDCIIVLDSYFNFTKKSNLVGSLVQFFKLVVAYFFGPPCRSLFDKFCVFDYSEHAFYSRIGHRMIWLNSAAANLVKQMIYSALYWAWPCRQIGCTLENDVCQYMNQPRKD